MGRLRLFFTLFAAAVAVAAGAASVSADGAPLTLEISTAQRQCTAGSLATVAWSIRGGTEPYQLVIDGEPLDPRAGSAAIRCGAPLPDALGWLWGISPALNVEARVADASGASAEAAVSLALAPPLPPPTRIDLHVWGQWGDYRLTNASAYVRTLERDDQSSDRAPSPLQHYIIRWRERGASAWTYEEPDDRYRLWRRADLRAGVFYEFQVSRVRDGIERQTPDALLWSPLRTMASDGPPHDVTAHATRDSITVSWRSNYQSTDWWVSLSGHAPNFRDNNSALYEPFVAEKAVHGSHFHTVRFDDLLPGRVYTVQVWQADVYIRPEAQFDVRTEGTADETDLAAHQPKIVRAEVEDGVLRIEWLPPDAAPQTRHYVTAREYGTWDHALNDLVEEGVTSVEFVDFKPATTYRVAVEAYNGYRERDERIIETPPGLSEDRDWYDLINTRLRVDWEQIGISYGAFHISWRQGEDKQVAQVQWERDGYVMSSIGEAPIMITVDQPGRYVFRARFRLDFGWSNWTEPAYATTKPLPPQVQVEEQAEATRIWWEPASGQTPADGYRIYYERQGEPEQVFTVRDATEITIPNGGDCGPYIVRVAAFNDDLGEGPPSTLHFRENRCGWVRVSFDTRGAACEASRSESTVVFWTIDGAVAPYTIIVQGHKPVQASGPRGWFRIYCQAEPEGGTHIIPVVVTDALGYSGTAEIELPARLPEHWRGPPLSVEIDALRAMNVEREKVRLSWHCLPWAVRWLSWWELVPPKFLLRWRNAASPDWTYINATATPRIGKVNNGCHWTWGGLTPGTRYEFQLAAWLHSEELAAPELLRWSPLETVTTLGDAQDVRINREQDAIVVSWRAQPDAWAYQVVLRGVDASWWKYYLPGGEDVERAVFVVPPPDGRYVVEIITPPRAVGRHQLEPGFIVPLHPEY